jgi:DNA repair exonuclease SbcCD ATPase subunit
MSAAPNQHKHLLNLRETQLEMDSGVYPSAGGDDYDNQLQEAQKQLEVLQQKREELARQKQELDRLNEQKEEFVNGQIEMCEKLSASVTAIDRELFEMRQEVEDLEQTRQAFSAHLDRIERIECEAWPKESLQSELSRAMSILDQAEDEFSTAVAHFSEGRSRGIFGGGRTGSRSSKVRSAGDFKTSFMNGLAFNLPVLTLGAIALIAYLVK